MLGLEAKTILVEADRRTYRNLAVSIYRQGDKAAVMPTEMYIHISRAPALAVDIHITWASALLVLDDRAMPEPQGVGRVDKENPTFLFYSSLV